MYLGVKRERGGVHRGTYALRKAAKRKKNQPRFGKGDPWQVGMSPALWEDRECAEKKKLWEGRK